MVDSLTCAPMRKSRKSGNTNCIEAAACACHPLALFGDTKDRQGPRLTVSTPAYRVFVSAAAAGRFR